MANVSSGIRRKVDDLGRVVIPAGIRRSLNIREGDAVEVSVDGERVVLAKPRDACVFCGREGDDLHRFRNRLVCRECVATIGEVDGRLRAVTPSPASDVPATTDVPASPQVTAEAPAAGPAEPKRPPERPAAWPTGPIDGDALARQMARRSPTEPDERRSPDTRDGDRAEPAPQPAAYDPASTTAW